jgi:Acetyltransferase (GNAT) family
MSLDHEVVLSISSRTSHCSHISTLDCLFVAANCVEDKMLSRQIELMRIRRCVCKGVVSQRRHGGNISSRQLIYCHIAEIAVSCRHQNQGIGGRLLQAAEDWGRRQGAECASLEYHAANKRASVFYQQHMGYSCSIHHGNKTSLALSRVVNAVGRAIAGYTPTPALNIRPSFNELIRFQPR